MDFEDDQQCETEADTDGEVDRAEGIEVEEVVEWRVDRSELEADDE